MHMCIFMNVYLLMCLCANVYESIMQNLYACMHVYVQMCMHEMHIIHTHMFMYDVYTIHTCACMHEGVYMCEE